jgi:O-antigen/teichoic acid export membrane protein
LPLRQLNSPIMRVAVPTLAGMRDDANRFRSYYRSALVGLGLIGMPAVVVLAVLSHEIVVVLLGGQYAGAAPIFQMLAIAGVAQVIANTTGWLFIASSRTREMMLWGLVSGPIIVAAFLIGLPQGAFGVARAYAIASVVLMVPGFWYATRDTPVSMRDIAAAVWRPSVVAALVFAASVGVHRLTAAEGSVTRSALVLATAIAVWVSTVWAWPTVRRDAASLLRAMSRGVTGDGAAGGKERHGRRRGKAAQTTAKEDT